MASQGRDLVLSVLATRRGPHLHGDGGDNVLGIDEAWHAQVLDALGGKDGRASVKPGHVAGAVQQLRHNDT